MQAAASGPKIFISYRREDSAYVAGMLHDRLSDDFGPESVFLDIDNIPFGVDFRDHVNEAVGQCGVLLALIGDAWAGQTVGTAGRRIDDPADHLRLEIEAALNRSIPVVPVLIGTARMPKVEELPASLQTLAFRNAAELRPGRDFHHHLQTLLQGVDALLRSAGAKVPLAPVAPAEKKTEPSGDKAPAPATPTDFLVETTEPGDAKAPAAGTPPSPSGREIEPRVSKTPRIVASAAETASPPQTPIKPTPIEKALLIVLVVQLFGIVGALMATLIDVQSSVIAAPLVSLVGISTAIIARQLSSRIAIAMGLSAPAVSLVSFLLVYSSGWSPSSAYFPIAVIATLYAIAYLGAFAAFTLRRHSASPG